MSLKKSIGFAVLVAFVTASPISAFARADAGCDLPTVINQGELQSLLSLRAVEAINLALKSSAPGPQLERLIAPDASFTTGGGDVGVPLKSGTAGVIELAQSMAADTFRFLGWDYIPRPVENPCGRHVVQVEFTDSRNKLVYPVEFTFEKGRIVSAKGWSRSFQSGPIGMKH